MSWDVKVHLIKLLSYFTEVTFHNEKVIPYEVISSDLPNT